VAERSGESVGVSSLSTITTDNARNVGGDEVKVISPRESNQPNQDDPERRCESGETLRESYQDVDLVPLLPYPSTRGKTHATEAGH
jgi:hypothetical protein